MTATNLEGKKLINPVRKIKPGENIKYLLLIKLPESDETYWEIVTGREEAYLYIKNNIEHIDIENSYIIANKMKEIDLDNLHNIYDFVRFVKKENDIVDEFDIDDYYISSNIDTSSQIGVGLESAGNVFTGIAGSYVSVENDD